MTRRRLLRLAGSGSLGTGGALVLAACGEREVVEKIVTRTVERVVEVPVERLVEKTVEVPVERVVERVVRVPVERVVEKVVEVPVERIVEKVRFVEVPRGAATPTDDVTTVTPQESTPAPSLDDIRFVTNHTRGPRGTSMAWGLKRFAHMRPDIAVKLEPADDPVEALALQFYAGAPPDLALHSPLSFLGFHGDGVFTEITDELAKREDVVPEDYYFVPDTYTLNDIDHSVPPPTRMAGPQFGMPFQFAISGFMGNASLAEAAGVEFPDSDASWTWDDWTAWDAMMTDPEAGTFGTWARNDYHYQYMPQMYSNGLSKPFDDGLTRTMFDQPEAVETWAYLIGKVFEYKTSPTDGQISDLAGAFLNPFRAGKIGIWPSGQVSTTGVGRIDERFKWTLMPEVVAAGGGAVAHSWTIAPNLVTVGAERSGLIEQATALAVFLASEEYQLRVGIDRGHVPVHKAALGAPGSLASPPDGMKWLKAYADRPGNRGVFPFSRWQEWSVHHGLRSQHGWLGLQPPAESLASCQAWGVEFLSQYQGPKPSVREPVYP